MQRELGILKNASGLIQNTRIVFQKYQALSAWPYGHGRTHPCNMLTRCLDFAFSVFYVFFKYPFYPAGAADPAYLVYFYVDTIAK
jgi:hypothetical protein